MSLPLSGCFASQYCDSVSCHAVQKTAGDHMEIKVVASFLGKHENLSALGAPFRMESLANAGISIELMDGISITHIEQAIVYFVCSLRSAVTDLPKGGELRVAVYFSPDEVAAFVVSLPQEVIKLLADAGLALEVVGFPCSS